MNPHLILASSSPTRLGLLRAAGLVVTPHSPDIDEASLMQGFAAAAVAPHDIADRLAEMKARKIAERFPTDLVLGCDQVLDHQGSAWGKPATIDAARQQLLELRGQTHQLVSALVLYQAGQPVWRHTGVARLTMRNFSDLWLDHYLADHWQSIRHCVGCYRLEQQGVQLFTAVEGDYFTILGLPLLPLLGYLRQRGIIAT